MTTIEQLQAILNNPARDTGARSLAPCHPIVCRDGLKISVQAGWSYYSKPRENKGPWTHVEVGYPNKPMPELRSYKEPDSDVYGYVPIDDVAAVIDRHHGIGDPARANRFTHLDLDDEEG